MCQSPASDSGNELEMKIVYINCGGGGGVYCILEILRQATPAMDFALILFLNSVIVYVSGVSPARVSGNEC